MFTVSGVKYKKQAEWLSKKHLIGNAHTYILEHTSRFFRNYLSHFARKACSASKFY